MDEIQARPSPGVRHRVTVADLAPTAPDTDEALDITDAEVLPDDDEGAVGRPLIDEDIASCTSVDDLRGMWHDATPDQQALIRDRVAELQAESEDPR